MMKRITSLLLLLTLLLASFIPIAKADDRMGIETPYSEQGASIIGALNLFKAVFPDTQPGQEEWYLNINWTADPYRGYLSMPLSLPGYGKYTSEKLDTFMERTGVPVKDGQYTLYGLGETLVGVYAKGEKGKGSWAWRPPTDDYAQVMARLTPAEIADLAARGTWQINPRSEIPEIGPGASPGWLTQYYFLPPDLQVKDLKTTSPDAQGRAAATATFYNSCNFGGATKVYLYRVLKDGTKELLKEQEVYVGPFKTATLQAEYVASNTKGVAASIARPWTGTEWGYGHFKAENGIYELDGYAVETGSGAYPPELMERLRSNWDNNVKEAGVVYGVDVAVTVSTSRPKYVIPFNANSVKCPVNIVVTRKDGGNPVPARVTVECPLGNRTFDAALKPNGTWKNYVSYTVSKAGTYPVKVQVWPVGFQDVNPKDNTASLNIVVEKQKPPEVPREPGIHSELGGGMGDLVWDPVLKKWVKR